MTRNERFFGAWKLDASIRDNKPLSAVPTALLIFDRSGHFCADIVGEPYTSYFGTWSAEPGDSGTLLNQPWGTSRPDLIVGEQRREFRFTGPDTLVLSPRPGSELTWRRLPEA